MQKKQNPITRSEVFTVASAEENDYGALMVTSTAGKEYKIGDRRANLFPIFQPGASVEVGYSEYMNKEYIATAAPAGKASPTEDNHAIEHPAKPSFGQDSPEKRRSIERQFAVGIAFEHGINEEDTPDHPSPWTVAKALKQAERIYQWISADTMQATSSTSETSQRTTPKPQPATPVSKVTPETVYGNIKTLIKDMPNDKAGESLKNLFAEVGAVGKNTSEKLASLSEDSLLKVSARVNTALQAKKIGAEPISEDCLPF